MKYGKISGAMVFGLLLMTSAHAHCSKVNLEGSFENKSGGRFHITQPTCEQIMLTDLQNNMVYEADFRNPANPVDLGDVRSTLARLSHALPISIAGKVGVDHDGDHSDDAITLYVQTRIHLKKSEVVSGLSDPLIRAKIAVIPLRANEELRRFGFNDRIYIELLGFEAIHEAGESNKQKVFVGGINVGLSVLSRVFGYKGARIYDELEQIN